MTGHKIADTATSFLSLTLCRSSTVLGQGKPRKVDIEISNWIFVLLQIAMSSCDKESLSD